MRIFGWGREAVSHGAGTVSDAHHGTAQIAGGVSSYAGIAPIPHTAAGTTINGVPTWVPEIWGYYDATGEMHFTSNFLGSCLSRCSLRLGVLDKDNNVGPAFDEDGNPMEGVDAELAEYGAQVIASLRTAPGVKADVPMGGQSLLLGRIGTNLGAVADCYLFGTGEFVDSATWEVVSTVEAQPIDVKPGQKQRFRRRRTRAQSATPEEFTPDFYLRIYRPHPAFSGEADCSNLPMRGVLERLVLLTAEGVADSKSRLKGPGVYWLPCLASGTRVSTVARGAVPIEQVKIGEQVWSYDPDSAEMVKRPVIGSYEHQASESLIVSTGNQRVQMTEHHRMMRLRRIGAGGKGHKFAWEPEWAEASDLRVDDWLVCAGPLPDTGVDVEVPGSGPLHHGQELGPTPLTPDVAWLLGLLVGDGHVYKAGGGVALYVDGEAGERARQIVWDTWGVRGKDHSKGKNVWTVWTSTALCRILTSLGLAVNHTEIRVPEILWSTSDKHRQAFLDGLMAADGHVRSDGILSLGLGNEELIRDARAMFIQLGWCVSNVSTAMGKAHDLQSGDTVIATRTWKFEVYPNQELRSYKAKTRANLGGVLGPQWHLRKIRSITPGGPVTVHDLQVRGTANYLADGLVSHNSEIDFPGTEEDPEGEDYMTNEFIETAGIAIKDPTSASRHVPIVSRAPAELIDHIRHDRFDYGDSSELENKRNAAVRDFARGTDLPFETTVGMSDTTFANAFFIDEQLARLHVVPWLELVNGFLTWGILTPALRAKKGIRKNAREKNPPEITKYVVWYDISGLVNHPNPEKTVQFAYGTEANPNFLVSARGARQKLGITEADRPDDEEIRERMERSHLLRMRSEVGGDQRTGGGDGDPSPDDSGDEPDKDEEVGKRVMGQADYVVQRTVDHLGSKLRSKVAGQAQRSKEPYVAALKRIDGVDAADVARVLGPQIVENLGGARALMNGELSTFERTVRRAFEDAGRSDAADLAAAAVKMVERVALARLFNPSIRLDIRAAEGFMDLLTDGRPE